MNDSSVTPPVSAGDLEATRLRQELQIREQLSAQLAAELFRLMQDYPEVFSPALPPADRMGATARPAPVLKQELEQLRRQLQALEQQIPFYQEQIAQRDAEIIRLSQVQQDLSDRNLMLEQVIQELPEVYRQKFAERLVQVKQKMESLEQENRRLQAELQHLSYHLAAQARRSTQVELPNLAPLPTPKSIGVASRVRPL